MEEKLLDQLDEILYGGTTGEELLAFLLGVLTFVESRDGALELEPPRSDVREAFQTLADKLTARMCVGSGPEVDRFHGEVLSVIDSVLLPQRYEDEKARDQLRRLREWLTLRQMYDRRDNAEFERAMYACFAGAVERLAEMPPPVSEGSLTWEQERQLRLELREAQDRVAELEAERQRLRQRLERLRKIDSEY